MQHKSLLGTEKRTAGFTRPERRPLGLSCVYGRENRSGLRQKTGTFAAVQLDPLSGPQSIAFYDAVLGLRQPYRSPLRRTQRSRRRRRPAPYGCNQALPSGGLSLHACQCLLRASFLHVGKCAHADTGA